MVSTTRPISCLTLRSRSGVPIWPRKYFETTTLVASCDQKLGISTSLCSKTTSPFSLPITADAEVPLDLVERIDTFAAEEPDVLETRDVPRLRHRSRSGRAGRSLAGRLVTARPHSRAKSSASLHIPSANTDRHLPPGSAPKAKIVMERRQTGDVRRAGKPWSPSVGWRINMDPVYSFVKAGSTRYCDSFLGQTQDVRFGGKFVRYDYFSAPRVEMRTGLGRGPRASVLDAYRPASSVASVSAFVARLCANT